MPTSLSLEKSLSFKLSDRRLDEGFRRASVSSTAFARRVRDAALFAKDENQEWVIDRHIANLEVDFTGAGFFALEDIATLALVIRRVAEAGVKVAIRWPRAYRGRPSSLQWFLEQLRFADLFGEHPAQPWAERIRIQGRTHPTLALSAERQSERYVPMVWFDRQLFDFDQADPWLRSLLKRDAFERFRLMLASQGFGDEDTIKEVIDTLFYELGWNTVLHSGARPGDGYGVFCAQVLPQQASLSFCVADLGRGIPATLREAYNSVPEQRKYHLKYQVSEHTGIVRFSLDNDATCRKVFPSPIDETARRGLAIVVDAVRARGQLLLRSDGALVRFRHSSSPSLCYRLEDSLSKVPIPGTQITGVVTVRPRKVAPALNLPDDKGAIEFDTIRVCGYDGGAPCLSSPIVSSQFIDQLPLKKGALVFDFGYADPSGRNVEYLFEAACARFESQPIVFWNVRSPWAELQDLCIRARDRLQRTLAPLVVVRRFSDARLLGLESVSEFEAAQAKHRWLRRTVAAGPPTGVNDSPVLEATGLVAVMRLHDYLSICRVLNRQFIESGFHTEKGHSGFFTGSIHLFRGDRVARYFSLANHLATKRDSNLLRWSESCAAAIALILQEATVKPTDIMVLGFAANVHGVCVQVQNMLGPLGLDFGLLLPYDLPTRSEIEEFAGPRRHFILVTDVISSGSLLNAVLGLIRSLDREVLATVALLDARALPSPKEKTFASEAGPVLLMSCGEMSLTPGEHQLTLEDDHYWVDPVSLVPYRRTLHRWEEHALERIETMLQLLENSAAAVCGHLKDGTRHSCAYVQLATLLDYAGPAVEASLRQELTRRLDHPEWRDFSPRAILVPLGISRVDRIGPTHLGADERAIASGAERCCEMLQRQWPSAPMIRVPRAFDPAGRTRCAKTIALPDGLELSDTDVAIADDGLWSGTTASAMISLAISLGAKRVVVVPLIARLSPEALAHWESAGSTHSKEDGRAVPVCYVFPLVLPIPYTSEADCPYDVTSRRIRDRVHNSKLIRRIPRSLEEALRPHAPDQIPGQAAVYTSTWLRVRAYAEMASESEDALVRLKRLLDTTDDEKLRAVFSLFLQDWSLAGRARLRQEISQVVRAKARDYVLRPDAKSSGRIIALSLLRSRYIEDFLEVLEEVAEFAIRDPDLLERIVFHLATLGAESLQRPEAARFLEQVAERGAESLPTLGLSAEDAQQYFESLRVCRELWLRIRSARPLPQLTARQAALEARKRLRDKGFDEVVRHETRSVLEQFHRGAFTLVEWKPSTFGLYARDWQETQLPFINERLVPLVAALHGPLLRANTPRGTPAQPGIEYLLLDDNKYLQIQDDITAITTALDFLSHDSRQRLYLGTLSQSAGRLLEHLLAENSTFLGLLNLIEQRTVEDVIEAFSTDIRARLSPSRGPVEVVTQGMEGVDRKRKIFAPSDVIHSCFWNILDNLQKYAFPSKQESKDGVASVRLLIRLVEGRTEAGDPLVKIMVKNNGTPLDKDVAHGHGGRRADADLREYGYILPPHRLNEVPWQVAQEVNLILW